MAELVWSFPGEGQRSLREANVLMGLAGFMKKALRAFTGNENFEERCDIEEGWMDRNVFDYLVKKFGR